MFYWFFSRKCILREPHQPLLRAPQALAIIDRYLVALDRILQARGHIKSLQCMTIRVLHFYFLGAHLPRNVGMAPLMSVSPRLMNSGDIVDLHEWLDIFELFLMVAARRGPVGREWPPVEPPLRVLEATVVVAMRPPLSRFRLRKDQRPLQFRIVDKVILRWVKRLAAESLHSLEFPKRATVCAAVEVVIWGAVLRVIHGYLTSVGNLSTDFVSMRGHVVSQVQVDAHFFFIWKSCIICTFIVSIMLIFHQYDWFLCILQLIKFLVRTRAYYLLYLNLLIWRYFPLLLLFREFLSFNFLYLTNFICLFGYSV